MNTPSVTISSALPAPDRLDADACIDIYQMLRPIMPRYRPVSRHNYERLIDILDEVDALILDGFGVINVGDRKIDNIDELLDACARAGKIVVVLTNGASHPSAKTSQKYNGWGLALTPEQVVSSRDAFEDVMARRPASQLISLCGATTPLGSLSEVRFDDDDALWSDADGAVLLGTTSWNETAHIRLEQFLRRGNRTLHIANPDISAPHSDGFSDEPGYWAARVMAAGLAEPSWYGKPHAPAFELAIRRVELLAGRQVARERIVMVGDSPHTDILGGNAAGLRTALITSYGLLRDHNADRLLDEIGIQPDFLVRRL